MKTVEATPALSIRMAQRRDADAFAVYLVEHVVESGADGAPHFTTSRSIARYDARDAAIARWDRPLDEPLWGRAWLLCAEGPRRIVGHIELRGGRVRAELHRATVGMGIRREFTRKGYGRALLEAAIRWARFEQRLVWLDLGVFSGNEPARRLYERFGFVEVGRREDAFRTEEGVSLEDIQMTLSLERRPGSEIG